MNLKNIKRTLHEIRYFKKVVKKYGNLLEKGKYRLFPSMRALVLDSSFSIEKANPYFAKKKAKSKTASLIARINKTNYYRNKNKHSLEEYEAVYSANNYDAVREIKLFSFKNKQILTFCTSVDVYKRQIKEYEILHNYFGMPSVEQYSEAKNAFKISMVEVLERPSDVCALKEIAHCVSECAKANFDKIKSKKVSEIIKFNYDDAEISTILSDIASHISKEILDQEIGVCLQHGDLSRDNIIYGNCDGKTGFWWIDWEHSCERIFFYDYFFYILNTAIYFSDKSAINSYLNGECDEHLENFFSQIIIKYENKYRKEYFLVFAVAFLKERVCDLGYNKALKEYYDFIKETVF